MKRGLFFTFLAIALVIAFIYSIIPGSLRPDVAGTDVSAPKKNGTIHRPANTTDHTMTPTTTRASPIEIMQPPVCRVNADCGIAYLASCHCDGDDLSATQYIPLCIDGSCVWKSKTDGMFCRGREYESGDNSTGQRCVNGFGRCVRNSEIERFFVLRENVTVINGVNRGNYTGGYRSYFFRTNMSGFYSGSSMCYENEYFLIDYKKTSGESGRITVSWNKSAIIGSVVVKVGGTYQDENGSVNPILWIRKALKNDTGYF
jgi:hypothetical protein